MNERNTTSFEDERITQALSAMNFEKQNDGTFALEKEVEKNGEKMRARIKAVLTISQDNEVEVWVGSDPAGETDLGYETGSFNLNDTDRIIQMLHGWAANNSIIPREDK
jgi:hypothetical protein